jgi:hypothetical protein
MLLVLKLVGRVRVPGGIAASGRERRKAASQPVTVPLLMMVAMVIVIFIIVIAVAMTLVFKMVRGLRVIGTTATRRELGKIPLLMMTVMLVLKVVRGLRVSALISASRDQWSNAASKPVTIPLLDGIGRRRRNKPYQGNNRDKRDEELLHF